MPALEHLEHRRDAVPELRVGDRAVRDRASAARYRRDVRVAHAHAVDEQRLRVEHAEFGEERDRRLGALGDGKAARAMRVRERALALAHEAMLGVALRDVHRDAATRARNQREERVGDRVRRVRRDADLLELRLEHVEQRELFREARRGLAHGGGIGGRGEDFLIHDPAHAALAHRFEHHAGVAGVGEGRDAGAQPLDDSPARRVEEALGGHHRDLRALESRDPFAKGEILEQPAKDGELEMRVRVDEAREQRAVAEVAVGAVGSVVARADVDDASRELDHRAVANRRRRDGEHPSRVVANHRAARVPCTYGSKSAWDAAPTRFAISSGKARSPTCARVCPSEPSERRTPRSCARCTSRSCGR